MEWGFPIKNIGVFLFPCIPGTMNVSCAQR